MKMSEAVQGLEVSLAPMKEHLASLDEIELLINEAKVSLAAAQDESKREKAALAQVKSDFEAAKSKAQRDLDASISLKTKDLHDLEEQVAEAKARLETLTSAVQEKSTIHQQIEASLTSMRKTLGI